ncbi:MAG: hypothetical protein KBS62_05780 [Oscillospiraceae bacterium]|nr:hypothetical protein [Candidatus Ruminococcus equi]
MGHGVRSVEDENLLKELADKQIPLELCPTSIINTGVYKSFSEWPLKKLMDSGAMITINTDDPSIEGTSIKKEYQKLIDTFGIGKEQVIMFLENSVNASFADDAVKEKMLNTIDSEINLNKKTKCLD